MARSRSTSSARRSRACWTMAVVCGAMLLMPPSAATTRQDAPATRIGDRVAAPERTTRRDDGRALIVPAEHRQLGRVYHVLPSEQPQVRLSSEAPLERFDGWARGVAGYAVAGPPPLDPDQPRPLVAGQFHLAVSAIQTGVSLRDEHLREPEWLDASKHPDIVFHLERLDRVAVDRPAAGPTQRGTRSSGDGEPAGERGPLRAGEPLIVRCTLVGVLSIRGVSRRVEIDDATLTYLPESPRTAAIAPGDLLAIRCRYAVPLDAFGITHPMVGASVAESIVLDQVLYLSTVEPSMQDTAKDGTAPAGRAE
jgi:hypothetical protein